MQATVEQLRPYLRDFDFTGLFVDGLGWDHYHAAPVTVSAGGRAYNLAPVAEKRSFAVFECAPDPDGAIPPYPVRRKVETEVAKRVFEHLIVYVDAARTEQVWQWVKRETGKPNACRERRFTAGQSGDPVLQPLREVAFSLEEEAEGLGVADVTGRVRRAFDVEKVTKRFYERFRTELDAFGDFIDGIVEQGDRHWYASLMLNRMMFVYFVQKQGFLDNDTDYLRNRLRMVQGLPAHPEPVEGRGRFQQFYRLFLLRLFHEGLGQPEAQRKPDLAALLGRVPFLNGGLFDQHELERDNPGIAIPDEAFERVFDFFDAYRWHLDARPGRTDNEIDPDVLGYIFEKYVNQKQMGAYYTKEDITGYIARNTVIPFLFDAAKKECPVAFGPDSGVWRLLRDDPGRYVYPAVAHGVTLDLPDDIAAGVADVAKRGGWNSPAPADYALPTETWREVVARRTRHAEVRARLAAGGVTDVNDCITLNLDVETFARDAIALSDGAELVRAFWKAVSGVSVLDPTCGSGAFLFAALNVLEPLYTACLEGMRGFLDDLRHARESGSPRSPNALSDFRAVLDQVEKHPSERYFILKSIVLNNLYGVDIMEEAVEICKLRLFLKLVAQLESYDQIEPLPDIDFNVRAGNTLVGFTSLDAVRQAMTAMPNGQQRMLSDEDRETLARIEEDARGVDWLAHEFRRQQTMLGEEVTLADKGELRQRLRSLANELDLLLASEYGMDRADPGKHNVVPANPEDKTKCARDASTHDAFSCWRDSHQPFHWFAEFHAIMSTGGFDVVIGNPPYVARQKVVQSYVPKGFRTANCPDIYATVVERSFNVCRNGGRTSMIVPLSLGFSSGFANLRDLLYQESNALWFSSFGRIPSALFSFDTRVRNTIYLARKSRRAALCFTTRLHRWFDSQRPALFANLSYSSFSPKAFEGLVPKIGNPVLLRAFESLSQRNRYRFGNELAPIGGEHLLHFKQTAYNWLTFCVDQPPSYDLANTPVNQTKYGTVKFQSENVRDIALLLASGKLMLCWWVGIGDDFDLTQQGFASAPFGPEQLKGAAKERLLALAPLLERAMAGNVVFKLNAGKHIGNYNLARCRHVTDEADKILLEALGMSDLWEEIELEHTMVVRTSYEDEE